MTCAIERMAEEQRGNCREVPQLCAEREQLSGESLRIRITLDKEKRDLIQDTVAFLYSPLPPIYAISTLALLVSVQQWACVCILSSPCMCLANSVIYAGVPESLHTNGIITKRPD